MAKHKKLIKYFNDNYVGDDIIRKAKELVNENTDLIRDIQVKAEEIINSELKKKVFNFNDMKTEMINGLLPILSDKTGRVPIILPIVMDIKSNKEEVK